MITDEYGDRFTPRGFRHAPPIEETYGGTVKVYESSAAESPHIWVRVEVADSDAAAHLPIETARHLAETILRICDLHYQN